jgi:hypothetical protein
MDIETQAEILLREAGYETWPWGGGPVPVVCFENEAVVGFIHVFGTSDGLLEDWQKAQEVTLARHAPALRLAGEKAWNVYSVFIAGDGPGARMRDIEQIEEDFRQTRKIARAGVQTGSDLTKVLLPLLPIISQPVIAGTDYQARLQTRLKDVSPEAVAAFLGPIEAADVARILAETI